VQVRQGLSSSSGVARVVSGTDREIDSRSKKGRASSRRAGGGGRIDICNKQWLSAPRRGGLSKEDWLVGGE
jgi:hypothetical protein